MPATLTRRRPRDLRVLRQRQFSTPTGELLRVFGPSKYTAEQQAAAPDEPLTRLVKDVLRVGRWSTDNGPWNVTASTLATVEASTSALISNGTAVNLVKTHGDPDTAEVHPDDLIAPLDDLAIVGDTLFATVYVTPAQAEYLRNPACKVSVRQVDEWVDGSGNKYANVLLHVAVVDLPVVGGQGPFTDLALHPRGRRRGRALSFRGRGRNLSMNPLNLNGCDLNKLGQQLAHLLALGGVSVPANLPGRDLNGFLDGVIHAVSQESSSAQPVGTDPGNVGTDGVPVSKMAREISSQVRRHAIRNLAADTDPMKLLTGLDVSTLDPEDNASTEGTGDAGGWEVFVTSPDGAAGPLVRQFGTTFFVRKAGGAIMAVPLEADGWMKIKPAASTTSAILTALLRLPANLAKAFLQATGGPSTTSADASRRQLSRSAGPHGRTITDEERDAKLRAKGLKPVKIYPV